MRRLALPLALCLGLLAAGSVSAGPKSIFAGDWIGNDPAPPDGDGSTVHLSIGGGDHPQISFTDEYGTVCEHVGSSDTYFQSTLTSFTVKELLVATFRTARCGSVQVKFLQGERMFLQLNTQGTEDPSDATMSDGSVTWHRV